MSIPSPEPEISKRPEPIRWQELTPEQQNALLSMADNWIMGGRAWRFMFWIVTSMGVIAAAAYYVVSTFNIVNVSLTKWSQH